MKKRFSELTKSKQAKVEADYHRTKPEELDAVIARAKPYSPKDSRVVTALIEEYKQLAWSFDRNGGVSSNLPPIVFTLITGLFFFGQVSSSQFVGFGVWLAVLFLLIWLGLIQSVTNHFGVKLAALEIKINKKLGVEMDDGLSFYSKYVGKGSQIVRGFKHYFALLTLLTIIVVIPASIKSWSAMTTWDWPIYFKMLGILIPPLLVIAIVVVMSYVDKSAVKQIDGLIKKACSDSDSARANDIVSVRQT